MTGFIPKEKLTAYQRWEVAAFDEAEQAAAGPVSRLRAQPSQAEQPPSRTISHGPARRPKISSASTSKPTKQAGYATRAGYEEGRRRRTRAAEADISMP